MDYSQFQQLEYRRKFWKLFGAHISIFNGDSNQLVGFIKMKAWKLREDIRLYTDASMQQEVIAIHARNIIDFGATYDISDSPSQQLVASLRRRGLKSTFVRDHWSIRDGNGNQIGEVVETSSKLAIMRRWFGVLPYIGDIIELIFAFIPQTYTILANTPTGSLPAGMIVHRKNPLIVKMRLDISAAQAKLDARILLAIPALLSIIDASKNS